MMNEEGADGERERDDNRVRRRPQRQSHAQGGGITLLVSLILLQTKEKAEAKERKLLATIVGALQRDSNAAGAMSRAVKPR